jgi:hypothetical protein
MTAETVRPRRPRSEHLRGWGSAILATGTEVGFLVGVNVLGTIRVDIVAGWDLAYLGAEAIAFLLGRDARNTRPGKVGMYTATVFLILGTLRVASVSAWPGIR